MASTAQRTLKAIGIAVLIFLAFFVSSGSAYALSTFATVQGGTGTSSPSGILYGDNGATGHLNTVNIGSGCTFTGGTLSCPGAGSITGTQGQNVYIGPAGTAIATSSLFIAPNGYVGIGSTSPSALLSLLAGANYGSNPTSLILQIGSSTAGVATSTLVSLDSTGALGIGLDPSTFNTFAKLGIKGSVFLNPGGFILKSGNGEAWDNSFSYIHGDGNSGAGGISNFINFATNNIERARFNSSGQFGIGTTSPYAQLSVQVGGNFQADAASTAFAIGSSTAGTATSTLFDIQSNGFVGVNNPNPSFLVDINQINLATTIPVPSLNLWNSGGGTGAGSAIRFTESASAGSLAAGEIAGLRTQTSPGTTALIFYPSNGTNLFEAMRLDGTGFLGLGTTSPYANLAIMAGSPSTPYASQAASTAFAIGSSTAGTATSTLFQITSGGQVQGVLGGPASTPIYSFLGSTGTGMRAAANNDLRLTVGGTDEFRSAGNQEGFLNLAISAGLNTVSPTNGLYVQGKAGFGTTTPTVPVAIAGTPNAAAGQGELEILNTQTPLQSWMFRLDSTQEDLAIDAGGGTGYSEVMRLNRINGFVGIGTTSPYAVLDTLAASSTVATSISTGLVSVISGFENTTIKFFQEIDQWGHQATSGDTPTLASCGTSSVSGNDNNGTITLVGVALTSCQLVFAHPLPATWTLDPSASTNSTVAFADVTATSSTSVTFGLSAGLSTGYIFYNLRSHF